MVRRSKNKCLWQTRDQPRVLQFCSSYCYDIWTTVHLLCTCGCSPEFKLTFEWLHLAAWAGTCFSILQLGILLILSSVAIGPYLTVCFFTFYFIFLHKSTLGTHNIDWKFSVVRYMFLFLIAIPVFLTGLFHLKSANLKIVEQKMLWKLHYLKWEWPRS